MKATTKEYLRKRNFSKTSEPRGAMRAPGHRYVIQKHAARRLHYDFRLELDGVLKSWAVPKEPSLSPKERRLAVQVEDHPVDYANFEGTIPKGEYGGGTVVVWDKGSWEPVGDPHTGLKKGHLEFNVFGDRLHGRWNLIRMNRPGEKKQWLLIKGKDEEAAEAKPETKLPRDITPELATLVDKAPQGENWIHETKFDGYRILAIKEGDEVTLLTRNRNDYTSKFVDIAKAIKLIDVENAIFDGEVAAITEDGTTDFQALQNSLKGQIDAPLKYYVFDMIYQNGEDIRSLPLLERKARLAKLLKKPVGPCLLSFYVQGQGPTVHREACRLGLEGIVSKRADSTYQSARTLDWQKVKCVRRQEFVIGGYTEPEGARNHFGSLLLGFYDAKGNLNYCGNVGTGFTAASLKEVFNELKARETDDCGFTKCPTRSRSVHWVKPELVAEVQFHEMTKDKIIRQGSFKGLRFDKPATKVVLETAKGARPRGEHDEQEAKKMKKERGSTKKGAKASKVKAASPALPIRFTHPDKVIFPEKKLTKLDLASYYQKVAERILPYLVNRPLSLVRCPDGAGKACFFQRHPALTLKDPVFGFKSKDETLTYIKDLPGLLTLVQFGALEIHPWGSTIDNIEKPDTITFDLDPDEKVSWKSVVSAAVLLRDSLQTIGLTSFVKTSGGKGLHIVVPIKSELTWDEVKNFTKEVCQHIEAAQPDKFVSTMSKVKRKGKIFIDYLRNARSATSVGAYSTRARPNATVSMPLTWKELEKTRDAQGFTVDKILEVGLPAEDPWKGFFDLKQSLVAPKKKRRK